MGNRPAAKFDEIAVVEAAYRLDGTEMDWIAGMASIAAPLLDEGCGVGACTFLAVDGNVEFDAIATVGGDPGFHEAVIAACRETNTDITFRMYLSAPCTSLATSGDAQRVESDPGSQKLLDLGIRDVLAVLGTNPGGYGVALMAYRRDPLIPSPRVRSRWSRIAIHLAAGLRLRRSLSTPRDRGDGCDHLEDSEAILTPSGRIEDAKGPAKPARDALARAVVAIERARGTQRAEDPDLSLETWRGLVAGRWSLVEHFDTDGRRFLLARKNDPDVKAIAGLSKRECQVLSLRARGISLKLIAYDLGLSVPSVSRSLRTGMAKLGVASEAELVTLFCRRL